MSRRAEGSELLGAAERARLEALAEAIEQARAAAAPPSDGRDFRGMSPADRPLDWQALGRAAGEIAALLRRAGVLAVEEAVALRSVFAEPSIVAQVVAWGVGREEGPPVERADLAWEVVRLALPPHLRGVVRGAGEEAEADELRQDDGQPPRAAAGGGRCPQCTAPPDLAILTAVFGARVLVCSTCDTGWRFDRVQCPFCGNTAQHELAYLGGGPPGLLIRVCDACGTYLKTVDRRAQPGDESPLLLRMLTVEMDLAARAAGYRPPAV